MLKRCSEDNTIQAFRQCITMSDAGDSADMEDVGTTPTDFFDHEPSKQEKIEVSAIF
jgi:hypothetical protein